MRLTLLIPILLAGCALPDQRTFMRTPPAPTAAELARPVLPARPLLTIRFPVDERAWRLALADAVQAAQARKPDVEFDIMAAVPSNASVEAQQAALLLGTADARLVATTLGEAGVPPDRLRLGVQGDPGVPAREVRVYVR
jgi:hypothetical protein